MYTPGMTAASNGPMYACDNAIMGMPGVDDDRYPPFCQC